MVDYRDWTQTLRRASFRGVPFFVESEERESGRRLHVHEYPHKDQPYVEDLGQKATHININAYVATEAIEAAEAAMCAALERKGAGTLLTPIGVWSAQVVDYKRQYNRDRQGYLAFAIKFVRTGSGAAPFSLLGLARAVEFSAGAILGPLTTAFQGSFSSFGAASIVGGSAAATFAGFLASFQGALGTTAIAPIALAALLRSVSDTYAAAPGLVVVGGAGDTYTQTRFVQNGAQAGGGPLVSAVFGLFQAAQAAMSAEDAAAFLRPWGAWDIEPTTGAGASTALINANELALQNVVRASALATYASAVVQVDYVDPRAARQARADVAEFFDYAMLALPGWTNYAVYAELAELRRKVVQHLSQTITSLAPIIMVKATSTMPSLWWANYLYGDANRGVELVKRNAVILPSFMPAEFEALSK